eukprot:1995185-Rhodomonas_salina.1
MSALTRGARVPASSWPPMISLATMTHHDHNEVVGPSVFRGRETGYGIRAGTEQGSAAHSSAQQSR